MRKKRLLVGGLIVLVIIGLLAGAASLGVRRIPPVAAQVGNTHPTTISIISPPTGSTFPADAAIPITAIARGLTTITALEYWVDGRLVRTEPPAEGSSPTFVFQVWKWLPIIEGDHQVTFRAIDSEGGSATSNILRLFIEPAAGYRILHTTEPEDTWQSVAESCSTNVEKITRSNSSLDPSQPLPAGRQIWIPCDPIFPSLPPYEPEAEPVADSQPITSIQPPGKLGLWIDKNLLPAPSLLPAPVLSGGLENCLVRLTIQDNSSNEQGFMIYRSGSSDFERIASLGANSTAGFTYDDTLQQSSQVQYYVSAYNSAGEAQSNILSVNPAEGTCGLAANALVRYENGSLVVGSGMDLAYVYASLDKGDWTRLPEGNGFFTPQNGRVDLLQYLSPLLKIHPFARQVDLQVWGWNGGAIQDLGPLTVTLDHTALEFCDLPGEACTGDVAGSMWSDQEGLVGSDPATDPQWRTFRFTTNTLDAPYMMVQIATQPFPPEFQADSPFLVESYLVNSTSGSKLAYGEFKIDFSALAKPKSDSSLIISPQTSFWDFLNPNPSPEDSPLSQYLIEQMNQTAFQPGMFDALMTSKYYIRVVPWDIDTPVGGMSNTIPITYKPIEQTTIPIIATQPPLFSIHIVDFSPEEQIDPPLFGCVNITAIDEAKFRAWLQVNFLNELEPLAAWMSNMGFDISPFMDTNGNPISEEAWIQMQIAAYQSRITSGDPICPQLYVPEEGSSSFLGDIWDAISSTWDALVNLFEDLKAGIVDGLASVLNTIMPGICDSTCRTGLKLGLNLAITYFTGIPPNLPTTDELVDKGLEIAIDAALNEAGIDFCDAFCKDQLKSGVKAAADQLKQANSQPACFGGSNSAWYGKKSMCMPDGITTEPVHGGAYRPPNVKISVTRNQQAILYSAEQYDFSLQVTSSVVNNTLVGQDYMCPGNGFGYDAGGNFMMGYFKLPVTEPASGTVYLDEKIPLASDLAPGTQFDLPVTLKAPKVNPYLYLPFQSFIGHWQIFDETNARRCSYRMLTNPGYTITLQAQLMCTSQRTGQVIPCPPSDIAITSDTRQYTP